MGTIKVSADVSTVFPPRDIRVTVKRIADGTTVKIFESSKSFSRDFTNIDSGQYLVTFEGDNQTNGSTTVSVESDLSPAQGDTTSVPRYNLSYLANI